LRRHGVESSAQACPWKFGEMTAKSLILHGAFGRLSLTNSNSRHVGHTHRRQSLDGQATSEAPAASPLGLLILAAKGLNLRAILSDLVFDTLIR
jgi:hypothetical protein